MRDLIQNNINLISVVLTICYIWLVLWVVGEVIEQAF